MIPGMQQQLQQAAAAAAAPQANLGNCAPILQQLMAQQLLNAGQGPPPGANFAATTNQLMALMGAAAAGNPLAAAMQQQQQQQSAAAPMAYNFAAPAVTAAPVVSLSTQDADKDDWAEPFAGKGRKEPPFPLKLHQILGNPEFSECICWNAHGRSWRILKPPVFEQVVIPLYFRHAK